MQIEEEAEYLIGEKIAASLKKEVDSAVMFGSGYKRNFTLPKQIKKFASFILRHIFF